MHRSIKRINEINTGGDEMYCMPPSDPLSPQTESIVITNFNSWQNFGMMNNLWDARNDTGNMAAFGSFKLPHEQNTVSSARKRIEKKNYGKFGEVGHSINSSAPVLNKVDIKFFLRKPQSLQRDQSDTFKEQSINKKAIENLQK